MTWKDLMRSYKASVAINAKLAFAELISQGRLQEAAKVKKLFK